MKLQGKTAIITGAAKGIGAAAVRRFAAEGARIVLADKDEANGHEVAKAIVKEGGKLHSACAMWGMKPMCRRPWTRRPVHTGSWTLW